MPLPRLLATLAMTVLAGCRHSRSEVPADPRGDRPVALTPSEGRLVDGRTPTLTVLNARAFEGAGASYEFVVMDVAARDVVERIPDVPSGATETSAVVPVPLDAGRGYTWKAVAHSGDRASESATAAFEVAVPCVAGGDHFAKLVVDFQVTDCTRRTNRRNLLDPRNVLGPPDASGTSDPTYSGFVSLGQDGYVVVDMGVCIADRPGDDLRVYQYIQSEPVEVFASGSPDGPWAPLGTKPCGEGGTLGIFSNHCDFDLATASLRAARYVWVADAENFPCERAGTRTEGADVDAIEALSIR